MKIVDTERHRLEKDGRRPTNIKPIVCNKCGSLKISVDFKRTRHYWAFPRVSLTEFTVFPDWDYIEEIRIHCETCGHEIIYKGVMTANFDEDNYDAVETVLTELNKILEEGIYGEEEKFEEVREGIRLYEEEEEEA